MPRPKILLVDDDEDVLRSTELVLNLIGYDAVPLADAGRTLDVCRRVRPDAILHDLRMKGADVPAILATLRKDPDVGATPIVLFSASPDTPEIAADLDAEGLLLKPFGEAELRSLLLSVVPRVPEPAPAASPAASAPSTPSPEDASRIAHATFHDAWNTLSAVASYASALVGAPDMPAGHRDTVRAMRRALRRLETRLAEAQRLAYVTLERRT